MLAKEAGEGLLESMHEPNRAEPSGSSAVSLVIESIKHRPSSPIQQARSASPLDHTRQSSSPPTPERRTHSVCDPPPSSSSLLVQNRHRAVPARTESASNGREVEERLTTRRTARWLATSSEDELSRTACATRQLRCSSERGKRTSGTSSHRTGTAGACTQRGEYRW